MVCGCSFSYGVCSSSATITVHKLEIVLEFHLLRRINLEFLGVQLVVSLFSRGALRLGPCVLQGVDGGTGDGGALRKK